MREGDVLVHHPYDSFATSVERFVDQAVEDPDVLAIKQTVYRTSDDTPLVPALIRATERGKQAVCMVELKARFDERTNIHWAKAMEEAGVHVVYGHPALKTHAKCILVVRREGDGVRNYVHVGTGNYHPRPRACTRTSASSPATSRSAPTSADMFNFLTGFGRPRAYREVLIAPSTCATGILSRDRARPSPRTARAADARIAMKMNALVDRRCIRALYAASQAGVPVDLNVRGICCLRPGVPGGLGEHPRRLGRRPVPRALAHLRVLPRRRGADRLHRLGRPDAAQPRQPRRAGRARARTRRSATSCSTRSSAAWPTTPTRGSCTATGTWDRRALDDGVEPRNMQEELMVGHAARSAEGPAPA